MNIQYFSSEPWEIERVKTRLEGHHIQFFPTSLNAAKGVESAQTEVISIFIDSKIGEAEMATFPNLHLISTRSTGFDHIDLAAAKRRGITVCNVPFYGENTVAEFAFALLLALSRKIVDADESVRERGMFAQSGLRGFDLRGKTIGIIGVGHIGLHLVRMAKGFEMNVLAYDVKQDAEKARELGFVYVSLEEALAQSDVVSIHVPYNAHTHHLINRANITRMKKGSVLINTARGAVLETEALVFGLQQNILAGAGLDVLEEEGELAEEEILLSSPHPNEAMLRTTLANHYLIKHPRVIVTPHIAFNTDEAVERIVDTNTDNLLAFFSNSPIHVVGN